MGCTPCAGRDSAGAGADDRHLAADDERDPQGDGGTGDFAGAATETRANRFSGLESNVHLMTHCTIGRGAIRPV